MRSLIEHMFVQDRVYVKAKGRRGRVAILPSVLKRLATALTLILTLVLAACGGDDAEKKSSGVPGNADPAAVRVIDAWTKALDKGDIDAAARYFAIPADTQNGIALRLRSRDDARAFNQSLPCGAKLVSARQ